MERIQEGATVSFILALILLQKKKKDHKRWRTEIANKLKEDAYVEIIASRIDTDDMAKKSENEAGVDAHEKYCKWIKKGSSGDALRIESF